MRVAFCVFVTAAAMLSSCSTDLGTCNMPAAKTVVYTGDGTPYYAGQALVEYSCAHGVCHSASATNDFRKGAPHGLDFDLSPLTLQSTAGNIEALRNGIAKVRDDGGEIHGEINGGTMPPGPAGARLLPAWKLADGRDANLPVVGSDVGVSTVRNWLACGAPLVSGVGTAAEVPAALTISGGDVVPARDGGAIAATFDALYTQVISPKCATCHSPTGSWPSFDLSTADLAFANTVNKPGTAICTTGNLITPGSVEKSLLYQKLTPQTSCGTQMPFMGPYLAEDALKPLREWIVAGAPRR
ncbi:MAG: hypothetical protein RL701_664 [Pseudomonadota bacterium]|jgi:hypothetical protein